MPPLIPALLFCALAAYSNADLREGRAFLFMDEQISVDEALWLFSATSFGDLLFRIVHGQDLRYGQIFHVASAAVAHLPYRWWGEPGLIVAIRMWNAALLAAAYVVFGWAALRTTAARVAAITLACLLPSSAYYSTVPKPEPMQLLCLSIAMLLLVRRRRADFWPWFFVGLGFGAKISTLPALAVLACISFVLDRSQAPALTAPRPLAAMRLLLSIVALGMGAAVLGYEERFGIVARVLLGGMLIVLGLSFALLRARVDARLALHPHLLRWLGRAGSFLTGFFVAVPCVIAFFPVRTQNWFGSTFLNTTHGADDSAVGPLAWLRFIFTGWSDAPALVVGLVATGTLLAVGLFLASECRTRVAHADVVTGPLAFLAAGAALGASIVLSVHRVWDFYLHPAAVFVLFGAAAVLERLGSSPRERRLALAVVAGWSALGLGDLLPAALRKHDALAHRTATAAFVAKRAQLDAVTSFVDARQAALGRPIAVLLTPDLFQPQSTRLVTYTRFWGHDVEWQGPYAVLVVLRSGAPGGPALSPSSREYEAQRRYWREWEQHVSPEGSCREPPCYRVRADVSDGEILVLERVDDPA